MEIFLRPALLALTLLGVGGSINFAVSAQFRFREPLPRTYELALGPGLQSPVSEDDWLPAQETGADSRRVLISSRLVLQLQPGARLTPLLRAHGLTIDRVVADDLLILTAGSPLKAAEAAATLSAQPEIKACYPIMRREVLLEGAYAPRPDDQYFMFQGYHEFRDQDGTAVGADINLRAAWPHTKGAGVTLAIVDSGVQTDHPEIVNQLAATGQHNFATGLDDGAATKLTASWAHGISVAGLALAQGNNQVGMTGVAPGARLASWVIFDENLLLVGEDRLMDMYEHHNETIWVQNHSWGSSSSGLAGPGLLEQQGIANAIQNGRDGKGVVMVRSGGNRRLQGGNVNDDYYVSDPRVIAVAAVSNTGRVASYSEPGAALLVAAPGGDAGGNLFTLDFTGTNGVVTFNVWLPEDPDNTRNLWDYRFDSFGFSGTSASAPLVSGVSALMLSANPELGYRDVQHILALSARHLDQADPDLHTNAAGFLISHNQGFGVVDAGQAVQLAKGWVNRPAAVSITNTAVLESPIPDDGYRLEIAGTDLPDSLIYVTNRTSIGPLVFESTAALPVVDVGLANSPLATDLSRQGGVD